MELELRRWKQLKTTTRRLRFGRQRGPEVVELVSLQAKGWRRVQSLCFSLLDGEPGVLMVVQPQHERILTIVSLSISFGSHNQRETDGF